MEAYSIKITQEGKSIICIKLIGNKEVLRATYTFPQNKKVDFNKGALFALEYLGEKEKNKGHLISLDGNRICELGNDVDAYDISGIQLKTGDQVEVVLNSVLKTVTTVTTEFYEDVTTLTKNDIGVVIKKLKGYREFKNGEKGINCIYIVDGK